MIRAGLLLSLICTFLTCVQPIDAQRKKTPTRNVPQIKTDSRPFQFSIIDDLPPNYLGHSYSDVIKALENRRPLSIRGEYETTATFNQRIRKLNEGRLTGTTTFNDRLAFSFVTDDDQFSSVYDADFSSLNVLVKWAKIFHFATYKDNFVSLRWDEKSRLLGTYVGRNAFNRAVRVKAYRNDFFYLVTQHKRIRDIADALGDSDLSAPSIKYVSPDQSLKASFPLEVVNAPRAKANLRMLIVGRLAPEAYFTFQSHTTPEISDPFDRYNYYYAVNIEVEEIWIYDLPTGRVYMRFASVGENRPTSAPSLDTLKVIPRKVEIFPPVQ